LRINYPSLIIGFILSYPIIKVLIMVSPEITSFALILPGFIFLCSGLYFKISIGMFYRKAELEENPFGYWFNMGQAFGFIVLGIFII